MPVIVVLGLLVAIVLTLVVFAAMFFSVAFSPPVSPSTELSAEEARALFRRISHQPVDPANRYSPTFGDLVLRGHLEDLVHQTSRSLAQ